MNFTKKIRSKIFIGIFATFFVATFSFVNFASAQYDDYSSTGYSSYGDYSSTGYSSYGDYSSTGYSGYGDYSSTGYAYPSDYSSTGYTSPSNYSSTGYTSPYDYSSTGYTGYNDYSSTGYTSPYDYSSTGYTSPSNYSSTGYTSPYDYSSTGYTSPSAYSSTGYNSPLDYSSTGYNSVTDYSSTGYNTPIYSSTGYNTPVYSSTGYNTPIYSSTGYYTPTYSYGSYGYNYGCGSSYCSSPSYYSSSYSYPVYTPPVVIKPQPVALTGSCVANTYNANINDTVTWTVSGVSGGAGSYTYSWTGTDGLSGTGPSISRSYGTSGAKSATVTIMSGNKSIVRNCSTNVKTPYVPPVIPPVYNNLVAYCSANQSSSYMGNSINWYATVSGGAGNYTYSWSGSDGLSGNGSNAYMTYNTPGTKYAYMTVYSNGQSLTANCSTYINQRIYPITYVNPQPRVVYQNPYQQVLHGISLLQVPYTGFNSYTNIILFTLVLGAWSAAVTYIIIRRKAHSSLAIQGSVKPSVVSSVLNMTPVKRTGAGVYWPRLGGTA